MALWVSIEQEREGSHPEPGEGSIASCVMRVSTSISSCDGEGGGRIEEYEARVPGRLSRSGLINSVVRKATGWKRVR